MECHWADPNHRTSGGLVPIGIKNISDGRQDMTCLVFTYSMS